MRLAASGDAGGSDVFRAAAHYLDIRMRSAFAKFCDGYLKRVNDEGSLSPCSHTRGFILPLTLWMIALTGLLAAALNVWVGNAVANSESLARRTELELAQANLRNELVYLLGTRPTSFRGLEVGKNITFADGANFNAILAGPADSGRYIKFDGRSYTSESAPDLVMAIQDGTGLINLNIATSVNLRRVLTSFDLPEAQVNRLIDTLLDYIDDDDFTRLAGAERTQYARMGLRPPANGLLMTPAEAQRVMGWDQLGPLWEADMASPLFTTCQSAGFNPNSAPPQALVSSVRGMTRDKAEQVLAARTKRPFRNTAEFGAAADLLITDEPFFYTFIPGPCVVVDLVDKRSGQHARFALTLEPVSMTRPWRVDYATTIPAQYRAKLDNIDPEAVFPAPESVDPATGPDTGKPQFP